MWRRLVGVLASCSLATIGAAALAASEGGASAAEPSSNNKAIEAYERAMLDARYADALASASKLSVEPENRRGRALADAMRASALLALKRDADARALMNESDQLAPEMSEPTAVLLTGALMGKRFDAAADAVDRMIARYPDAMRAVDWNLMRFFWANEPKTDIQRNNERQIELARIGYGGDTERGHYLVKDAVDLLVDKGNFAGAAELLPYVKEPVAFENMLILRRYAPMWPQIEQAAGKHLAKARADALAAAEREYNASPEDHDVFANYVNALRHAGRLDDALALRASLPKTSAEMSNADEGMGWAINNMALALYDLHRGDEADRLFALLNSAPMERDYWRVSMKINRLEALVFNGKFSEALPLIEPTARTEGSPYADQLVRRLRYCTLNRLGRGTEADKYKTELLAHAADAPGPTIDGLLCVGDTAAAEQIALTALANSDRDKRRRFEMDFVRQLQAQALTGDDPSVWQGRWAEFRKRPQIAAAFDRLGRDLPAEFLAAPIR